MAQQLPDQATVRETLTGRTTDTLQHQLRTGRSVELRRRRGVVGLSLAGMAAMGAVTLLQTGLVDHLPDPPIGGVDSDAANLSDEAFKAGVPDGPLALRSFAASAALATIGGEDRARERPAIPILAAAKSAAGAWGAVKNISKMARGDQSWSPYRLAWSAASVGIFALAVPEAIRAIKEWL